MKKLLFLALIPLVGIAALAAACNDDDAPPATPGRIIVDAPIDDLELVIRESFPPQYAVRIVSGLPSGSSGCLSDANLRSGISPRIRSRSFAWL